MHPILISLGPLRLYSYGVLVAIGVISAILFLRTNAKHIAVRADTAVDLAITTVLSGFIAARIFYVVEFWDFYRHSPLDILKIWEGGIVYYGGLLGGLLGFSLFIRFKHLPFLKLLDLFVPALALAQGFGRIGCFLNGCCFGKPTTVPWGVSFPFLPGLVHPTQLYESAFCFVLFFVLLLLWQRHPKTGTVALTYFMVYPIGRFIFEFFRGDHVHFYLGLSLHQWLSFAFVLVTALSYLLIHFSLWKKEV